MIGLYGGTFDPVHNGHIHAALSVQKALPFSQVRLVLAARPGHRKPPHADVMHRWRMLCLAVEGHPELVADDREMHRRGHSYTIDTVQDFGAENPGEIPAWILGQDAFATLAEWHRWEELLDHCNLVVVSRPGEPGTEPPPVQALWQMHGVTELNPGALGQIVRLPLPMQEVSATQIRRKIARGGQFAHLLAAPVCTYIKDHDLYAKLYRTPEETVI